MNIYIYMNTCAYVNTSTYYTKQQHANNYVQYVSIRLLYGTQQSRLYTCMCTSICIYKYIYIYTHIHVHIQIHKLIFKLRPILPQIHCPDGPMGPAPGPNRAE